MKTSETVMGLDELKSDSEKGHTMKQETKEATMATNYDCVYYFNAGTWHQAFFNCYPEYRTMEQTIADVERMGYPCVPGKTSIGAPEGAPMKSL